VSCYHPLKAYRCADGGVVFNELSRHNITQTIELPCGRCTGCRLQHATDWSLRVMHEAQSWKQNCFITLTYARDKLPPNGSLDHRDIQLFLKKLREKYKGRKIRYYMCGEYGPLNARPHYHMCVFNKDFKKDRQAGQSESGQPFYESQELNELWTHGIATVQELNKKTAGYCARYIMKKRLGQDAETAYTTITQDGEMKQIKPEYAAMSLKPGIGYHWIKKYTRDVFPHDYVIHEGTKHQVPKYYNKIYARSNPDETEIIQWKRENARKANWQDNTDERLKVRETVHNAKIRNLKRTI
jgi:hypothetical protein